MHPLLLATLTWLFFAVVLMGGGIACFMVFSVWLAIPIFLSAGGCLALAALWFYFWHLS